MGKVEVVEVARQRRQFRRRPPLPTKIAVAFSSSFTTPDCREEDSRRRALAIRPARRVYLDFPVVPEARGMFASVSRLVVLVVVALVAKVPRYGAAGHPRVLAEEGSYGGLRNTTAQKKKEKKKKTKKKTGEAEEEEEKKKKELFRDTREGYRVFHQVDVEEGPAIEWLASLS